ncbi:flagellar protein FlaG [Anaerovirgula multivorans]|uniref:Flagellar protein FlaG n=1 Tax=Anaerovirgula multivorans TaxID=312168 RepID=A0A239EVM7_9FIRM|nr:flagellar protein FlaG [Anaerovirgula multivorans]SNS48820.1 flagellar protein FlaG [Anaerovirgula multivorans]
MKVEGVQLNSTFAVSNTLRQGSQQAVRQDATAKEAGIPSEEQVVKAIERANKSFEPFDRRFEISVHEKMNAVMVKVINTMNDEVIREIPPEKILDMVAYMLEVAGILIDEKV